MRKSRRSRLVQFSLLEVAWNLARTRDYRIGQARQACHLDPVTARGRLLDHAAQKQHLAAPLAHRHAQVLDAWPLAREIGQLVEVGREQHLGPRRVMQVLGDRPRDRQPVERAGASPCTRGRTKTRASPSVILNSSLTVGWALDHVLVSTLRGSVIVEAPESRSRIADAHGGNMKSRLVVLALYALAGVAAGCSVYMEATRPTPVDLTEYQPGTTRDYIIGKVGAPENSVTQSDGANCDGYQMYTHGYGAGGKIPIAVAEGAADIFTLGLAEVVLTPTQGVTRNEKHPVIFCYKDQKLVRLTESGNPVFAPAEIPTVAAQALPSPAANPSPAAEVSAAASATSSEAVASPAVAVSPVAVASPNAAPASPPLAVSQPAAPAQLSIAPLEPAPASSPSAAPSPAANQ